MAEPPLDGAAAAALLQRWAATPTRPPRPGDDYDAGLPPRGHSLRLTALWVDDADPGDATRRREETATLLRGLHALGSPLTWRWSMATPGLRGELCLPTRTTAAEAVMRATWPGCVVEWSPLTRSPDPGAACLVVGRPGASEGAAMTWADALAAAGVPATLTLSMRPVSLEMLRRRHDELDLIEDRARPLAERTRTTGQVDTRGAVLINRGQQDGAQQWEGSAACQRLVDHVHSEREWLGAATSAGLWETHTWLTAADHDLLDAAIATLGPGFGEAPDRHTWTVLRGEGMRSLARAAAHMLARVDEPLLASQPRWATWCSATQLAALVSPPIHEYPGLALPRGRRFATGHGVAPPEVVLGHYIGIDGAPQRPFGISRRDLTGHVLVTGTTGGGKTSTVHRLLVAADAPFVVLEPTKSEYRALQSAGLSGPVVVHRPGLPGGGSLRINPFAFDTGTPLGTHLDMLKAVMNASFPMYGPMPYILEQALVECYRSRGWDLETGAHAEATASMPPSTAFPTLADLERVLDRYVREMGYADEQTANIRTALVTRVRSLRIGAKGQLLDGPDAFDPAALLGGRTVIELRALGDDDDKCFVMGLMLSRLYEWLEFGAGESDGDLRALLVIEEAHRLLRYVPPSSGSPEGVDLRGKSVETFENVLSEVRAHGVGVVVAEQLPTRMAPGAIKNTNIRLLHRQLATDDAATVVSSIGLEADAGRSLATLGPGEAIASVPGLHAPARVRMTAPLPLRRPTDQELSRTAPTARRAPPVPPSQRDAWDALAARLVASFGLGGPQHGYRYIQRGLAQGRALATRLDLPSDDARVVALLSSAVDRVGRDSHYLRRRPAAASQLVAALQQALAAERRDGVRELAEQARSALAAALEGLPLPRPELCRRCLQAQGACRWRGEVERQLVLAESTGAVGGVESLRDTVGRDIFLSPGDEATGWSRYCATVILTRKLPMERADALVSGLVEEGHAD